MCSVSVLLNWAYNTTYNLRACHHKLNGYLTTWSLYLNITAMVDLPLIQQAIVHIAANHIFRSDYRLSQLHAIAGIAAISACKTRPRPQPCVKKCHISLLLRSKLR